MTRIGVYDYCTNARLVTYKGLYRGNQIMNFYDALGEAEEFFNMATDGNSMEATDDHLTFICMLLNKLKRYGYKPDLICYTDETSVSGVIESFDFIGYDICADSMYYSPIGDMLLDEVLNRAVSSVYITQREAKSLKLNKYGLFSSLEDARLFANISNYLQSSEIYEFESETEWRPVAIYMYAD
ncbi:MAG: hypothetical protein IJC05_00055 [Phascolarctobacterium sp.]|nr:hypothetical protein [Phascolarctobacterium sp.]